MGAPERDVIAAVLRAMDPAQDRLFRINAGQGWAGRVVKRTASALVLAEPRPLHAAPAGWPDLFGWRSVTITPKMVGQTVAVARAVEIKAGGPSRGGRLRPEQARFKELLEGMGGLFEIAE